MTEDEIAVKFNALGGDVIGKDRCKELQKFIMSIDTADKLDGLFELTTARLASNLPSSRAKSRDHAAKSLR